MMPVILTLSLSTIAAVALTAGACHPLLGIMPSGERSALLSELGG